VNAADPMDDQNDLGCLRIDISDYLMNDGANDTLLQPRIGRQDRSPLSQRISRLSGLIPRIGDGGGIGGIMGSDFAFDLRCAKPDEPTTAAHKGAPYGPNDEGGPCQRS